MTKTRDNIYKESRYRSVNARHKNIATLTSKEKQLLLIYNFNKKKQALKKAKYVFLL